MNIREAIRRQKDLNRQALNAPTVKEAMQLREQAAQVGDEIDKAIANGTATNPLTTEEAYGLMAE